MKNTFLLILSLFSSFTYANGLVQGVIGSSNKYGIKGCNSFIADSINMIPGLTSSDSWYYNVSKHGGGIDGPTTELTFDIFYGKPNDSIHGTIILHESRKKCFAKLNIKFAQRGRCLENIDMNSWYIKDNMLGIDYIHFKNSGGVDLFAKEMNFNGINYCHKEFNIRNSVMK